MRNQKKVKTKKGKGGKKGLDYFNLLLFASNSFEIEEKSKEDPSPSEMIKEEIKKSKSKEYITYFHFILFILRIAKR